QSSTHTHIYIYIYISQSIIMKSFVTTIAFSVALLAVIGTNGTTALAIFSRRHDSATKYDGCHADTDKAVYVKQDVNLDMSKPDQIADSTSKELILSSPEKVSLINFNIGDIVPKDETPYDCFLGFPPTKYPDDAQSDSIAIE